MINSTKRSRTSKRMAEKDENTTPGMTTGNDVNSNNKKDESKAGIEEMYQVSGEYVRPYELMGENVMRSNDDPETRKALAEVLLENQYACYRMREPGRCDEVAGHLEGRVKNVDEAMKLYKEMCDDYDYPRSCYNYGRCRLKQARTIEDHMISYQYYKKGCFHGDKRSCYKSATLMMAEERVGKENVNKEEALDLYTRGCKLFEKHSCFMAHQLTRLGDEYDMPVDLDKALDFAIKGCEAGSVGSCINAYTMYRLGEGIPEDNEKAAIYRDMAVKEAIIMDKIRPVPLSFEKRPKYRNQWEEIKAAREREMQQNSNSSCIIL